MFELLNTLHLKRQSRDHLLGGIMFFQFEPFKEGSGMPSKLKEITGYGPWPHWSPNLQGQIEKDSLTFWEIHRLLSCQMRRLLEPGAGRWTARGRLAGVTDGNMLRLWSGEIHADRGKQTSPPPESNLKAWKQCLTLINICLFCATPCASIQIFLKVSVGSFFFKPRPLPCF